MMLQKPMIICYKLNWLTYRLGWLFASKFMKEVNCLGLPNICCLAEGLRVTPPIPELFQKKLSPDKLYQEMDKLFSNEDKLENQKKWLEYLSKLLPNDDYNKQIIRCVFSELFRGRKQIYKRPKRYDKIMEVELCNLSNVFDLGSYHQRSIPVKIINESEEGICLSAEEFIPLGRALIYSLKPPFLEEPDQEQLHQIKFIWSKKQGKNKYLMGGVRTLIKE